MLILYYAASVLFAAIVLGVGFIVKVKAPKKLNVAFKCISLVLAALLFFRYMSGDEAVSSVVHLNSNGQFSSKGFAALGLIQVWFCYAAEMFVVLVPFFNTRKSGAFTAFFALSVFALNLFFLFNHINAVEGQEALAAFRFRALLLSAETGVGLGFCVMYIVEHRNSILPRKKEWIGVVLGIVAMIAAAIPTYALHVVLDPAKFTMTVDGFNLYHRIYLYPIVIIPLTLYFALKNASEEERRFALMYYAWISLLTFSYDHKFADFFGENWVSTLPLHLCHTALYITPLCLTFKMKRLFYFTYFINVLGACFALFMPDFASTSVISSSVMHFFMCHYQAFFMPLLIVGLGIFRRPRLKEFKYSVVAFTIYFVLIIVINAWFTNYDPDVDFFYVNSDFIADKAGKFAEDLRLIVWQFDIGKLHFVLYPAYQAAFFGVYLALTFAMWFVYEVAYDVIHGWQVLTERNKKIRLDKLALDIKRSERCKEAQEMEHENMLVLKNFTKRYGSSEVYAVKDACLEVHGGEIFGFLGPNGAGKSTIIKSIVGIQTITDGTIEVCGYDVKSQSVEAKSQIGFVPDHYALYEKLTAREYVNYVADLYEVSQEDRDERLNRLVERFEFQKAIDNPIKTYSHGMKQKVTIMSALIHNPKVWILDEPLTGLDPNSIFQVKECMKEHAAKGNVVFFSSHIIDVVERICDRVAIICKGQIQCVKDVAEIEQTDNSLEAFYMSVINNCDVKPVGVEADKKDEQAASKPKRRLFGKKNSGDKENKKR